MTGREAANCVLIEMKDTGPGIPCGIRDRLFEPGGTFHGIDEAQLFFGSVNKYLDSHVAIELIINGGDRIAVIGRAHGTIKGTGGPFDVPIMHLWAFKDGLANRLEIVLDVSEMQAALRR